MAKQFCIAIARHYTEDGIRVCCFEPDLREGVFDSRNQAKITFIKRFDTDFVNATDRLAIMQFNALSRNLKHFKVVIYEG